MTRHAYVIAAIFSFILLHKMVAEIPAPAVAPAPDQTAAAPVPTPDASQPAVLAAAPETKSERLQGPDIIDINETAPTVIDNSATQTPLLFKQASTPLANITETLNNLIKMREDLYKQYFELDATIDDALQAAKFTNGTVEEIINPLAQQAPVGN